MGRLIGLGLFLAGALLVVLTWGEWNAVACAATFALWGLGSMLLVFPGVDLAQWVNEYNEDDHSRSGSER